mmetsp:Transcript_47043/g.117866  ORF Transcript_47043/g.117866 Transcript_47043/m.117866 type:complete len:431 (+) Transcript_47043:3-1295(+)
MRRVGLGLVAGARFAKCIDNGRKPEPPDVLPFDCSEQQRSDILDALKGVEEWGWNIFHLKEVSGNRELQVLGWHFLQHWSLITSLNLGVRAVQRWLSFVENRYNDTEYHNKTHAGDVLQAVYFMLVTAKVESYLSEMEIFALLISVMVHDLGHDGMNNNFHKNAETDRALTHNDASIQENHHIMTIFTSMKHSSDINILASLDPSQQAEVRRIVITVVLATDMSKHFVFMKEFGTLIEKKGPVREAWTDSTDTLMQAVMHMCDISNPARPRDLAVAWTDRCLAEFFRQGDLEKSMGLQVSPQCNRDVTSRAASQVGFIKFIVHPSYTLLGSLLPEVANTCVSELNKNLDFWLEQQELEKKSKGSHPGTPSISQKGSRVSSPMLSRTPDGSFSKNDGKIPSREGSFKKDGSFVRDHSGGSSLTNGLTKVDE